MLIYSFKMVGDKEIDMHQPVRNGDSRHAHNEYGQNSNEKEDITKIEIINMCIAYTMFTTAGIECVCAYLKLMIERRPDALKLLSTGVWNLVNRGLDPNIYTLNTLVFPVEFFHYTI